MLGLNSGSNLPLFYKKRSGIGMTSYTRWLGGLGTSIKH